MLQWRDIRFWAILLLSGAIAYLSAVLYQLGAKEEQETTPSPEAGTVEAGAVPPTSSSTPWYGTPLAIAGWTVLALLLAAGIFMLLRGRKTIDPFVRDVGNPRARGLSEDEIGGVIGVQEQIIEGRRAELDELRQKAYALQDKALELGEGEKADQLNAEADTILEQVSEGERLLDESQQGVFRTSDIARLNELPGIIKDLQARLGKRRRTLDKVTVEEIQSQLESVEKQAVDETKKLAASERKEITQQLLAAKGELRDLKARYESLAPVEKKTVQPEPETLGKI